MSTAVLEQPAVEKIPPYVMPQAQLGQFVMFYPDTGTNMDAGVVAQVIGVDRQLLKLNTFGHDQFPQNFISQQSQVRHRSDPMLKTNNTFILRNGSWDYTPWEKELRGQLAALQEQNDELRLTVQKLVSDLGGNSKSKKVE